MSKLIMNVKEVAQYLGVCPMTIYRFAKRGRIPAFRIGSDWRFHKDLVDNWIKDNSQALLDEGQRLANICKLDKKSK